MKRKVYLQSKICNTPLHPDVPEETGMCLNQNLEHIAYQSIVKIIVVVVVFSQVFSVIKMNITKT